MLPIKDHPSSGKFPVVTSIIFALTVIVFLGELFAPNVHSFLYQWGLVPSRVTAFQFRELVPFLTSVFLHGGFLHLIFNLWYLAIFADNVEATLGHFWFAIFYVSGGITANIIQFLFLRHENIPIIGASGAIAAVLGFYLVLFPHHTVRTLIPISTHLSTIDLPAQLVLGSWFLTQLFNGTADLAVNTAATSGIAWWAHIGGFLFGLLIAALFNLLSTKRHE